MKNKKYIFGIIILIFFVCLSFFVDSSIYLTSVSMYEQVELKNISNNELNIDEEYRVTPDKIKAFVDENRVGYLSEDGMIIFDK
ncbi:hypothetical protein GF354_03315 [Candidatus Peregrinibacteria bacterium]|nr:hypothetical protein [Candidatus Peregrinibacteria bacterium]